MTAVSSPPPGSVASGQELELVHSLRRMGIVSTNQQVVLTPLAGGVSSDIYRATVPGRVICVKRALGRLKVAADWQVPVDRNQYEVEWMRVAAGIVPGAVPAILGEDRDSGAFAMTWLPPDDYPVWQKILAGGA